VEKQLNRKRESAVLDELIRQLKSRQDIGRMLADLGKHEPDVVATQLIDELERIISLRHLQYRLMARTAVAPPAPAPQEIESVPPVKEESVSPLVEEPVLPVVEESALPAVEETVPPVEQDSPPPVVEGSVLLAEENSPPRSEDPSEQVSVPGVAAAASEQGHDATGESDLTIRKQMPRVHSDVKADDLIYLHGVSRIEPGEAPSAFPFLLEEKGIDNRSFAFAVDLEGLRFYGSTLNQESVNLTKNGVLLLGKQEKIRLRGAHESLLNDLRLHRIILPFEFGTVIKGLGELKARIAERCAEIGDALDELLKTRWWNLTVYALDTRTADLVATSTPDARRESDRGRVPYSSPAQNKRIDVKTLERILNKQKKAAESIHEALQPYAERFDIDMMVSLQSGASDDWKIILKASYEMGPSMLTMFVRTVTDLQYQHFLMELMLSLTGNVESFSFEKKTGQAG
jgi:hypothetical protein